MKIPGNAEFEACLIGACLRDEANLPLILGTLKERDFSSPKCMMIFRAMETLFNKGAPIDLLTLSHELHGEGILSSDLVEIQDSYFDGFDLSYYIKQIKELSTRRKLLSISDQTQDPTIEFSKINKQIREILDDGELWAGKDTQLVLPTFGELAHLDIKVEWLIDRLIPKMAITLLPGKGGIGKSWLGLQIGCAIAGGNPFCGLTTQRVPVYYIDFENPLALLSDRARVLGPSEMKVWHISNSIPPPRLDSKEWEAFKALPLGLLIFDTLRSANLLDENSSKDMALIMSRLKELREAGFTIILLHHTPKANERIYKGSTAIQDLCDCVLGLETVKEIGSDQVIDDDEEMTLPFRLGVRGKTRFEPFSMFLKLDPARGFYVAGDPENEILIDMQNFLFEYQRNRGREPNQTEFLKIVKDELEINRKRFRRLLMKGEGKFWEKSIPQKHGVIFYCPLVQGVRKDIESQPIENTVLSPCPNGVENNRDKSSYSSYPSCPPLLYRGTGGTTEQDQESDGIERLPDGQVTY